MIEAALRGETEWVSPTTGQTLPLSVDIILSAIAGFGMDRAVWNKLIRSLADGVEAKPVSQWVVLRTVVVGLGRKVPGIHLYVGKCFMTTTDFVAKEGVPIDVLPFDLPQGVWYKRTPTCVQMSSNQWQIEVEYWHADQADWFWEPA